MFRYVILGLLRDGASRHGYGLMKAYRERAGIQVSTGNFYRELQRLVAEGFVCTAPRLEAADARQAPYAITSAGAALFDRWFVDANETATAWNCEDQLSARILFFGEVPPEAASKVLRKWQDDLWVRAKVLERARDAVLAASSKVGASVFPALSLLLDRRMKHVASDLAFLEDVRSICARWSTADREAAAAAEVTNGTGGVRRKNGSPSEVRQPVAAQKATPRSPPVPRLGSR